MKRLTDVDINTPAHFDTIWRMQGIHRYDEVRLREFLRHLTPQDKALDVGCGLYGWAEYACVKNFCTAVDFTGIDFSSEVSLHIARVAPRMHFVLDDIRDMPFIEGSFDFVGSGETIEHMQDPTAFAAELVRVCRPGGRVVISTVDPNCEDSIRNNCEYPEHIWEFSSQDLLDLFSPYGEARYWKCGNYHMVACTK